MKTWKVLTALCAVFAPGLACADLDALKQDALSGKVDAQLELGMLYEFGYHYSDHDVDALAWYAIAAGSGNKLADERRAVVEGRLSPVEREAARARENELRAQMPVQAQPQPAPPKLPADAADDVPGAPATGSAETNSATIEVSGPVAIP